MKQTLAKLWQSLKAFAKRHKTPILAILISLAVVAALAVLIWLDHAYGWTGLGAYQNPNYAEQPRFLWGKTLWDWLDLLLVPVVLAIGGLLFNRAERRAEREIAAERTQEARLQSYLDKMTELMLEHGLRTSKPEDEARNIARARTLTALRSLDRVRKGILLQFLHESDLITVPAIIDLRMADLRMADLSWVSLYRAIVTEKQLSQARSLKGATMPDGTVHE